MHSVGVVRDLHKKLGVDAIPYQGYNPSVKTYGFATSPYTGEARSAVQTLSPVADTTLQSFCSFGAKSQLPLHRGAKIRPQSAGCEPYTGKACTQFNAARNLHRGGERRAAFENGRARKRRRRKKRAKTAHALLTSRRKIVYNHRRAVL